MAAVLLICLSGTSGNPACAAHKVAAKTRPNVVLIMADDLGFECLGCNGGTSYETPNLDKLAETGMRFVNCHSTPKCSPSRVTIMTGRYTFRTTTTWGHIPDTEITFGAVLLDAGYKTAVAGKWQMALLKTQPAHVQTHGFQESCVWAWHEGPRYHRPMIYFGSAPKTLIGRYGPDVYTEFLVDFISRNKDEPFFAYYPMCLTHFPKKDEPKSPTGKWETFKEMVENMDEAVGTLVAALDRLGLRDRTLILCTADNGSPTNVTSQMGGKAVQGGKAKLIDTGTHVPLIANWPGTVRAATTCEDLIDFSDFLPTLAELCGAEIPSDRVSDGRSFAPQLQGQVGTPRDWIYTQWSGKAWARTKRWKLYRDGRLYDMENDPEEESPIPRADGNAAARLMLTGVLEKLRE